MAKSELPICAFCGLPAPSTWWGSVAAGPSYCCYGCRFAARVADADGVRPEATRMFTRLGLAIFCTMNVMAFTMALWSSDVYEQDNSAAGERLFGLFRYLSLLFAFPVYYSLGLPLLENAWDSVKRGIANIDALLVVGVGASFLVSVHSVLRDHGPIYFEIGCMVLVFVTLGRWLEATGKAQASHALDALERMLPEHVRVLDRSGELEKPLNQVAVGDRLCVRAGERIPCDGILDSGPAHIDEQLLTGESAVHAKDPGAPLFAGTLNLDGVIHMTVTAPPDDGTLARLVRMTRNARASKGRFEQFADRVVRWFLPAVVVLALIAACYHGWTHDAMTGVLVGLSVILIACPCALGIATPLAMWTAINQAARHGVLIQGGDVLERLARVGHVCFDKTGTLTTGSPLVQTVVVHGADGAILDDAATLAGASRHVYSQAIARFLADKGVQPDPAVAVETVVGRGVRHPALDIVLGSQRWISELGLSIPDELQRALNSAQIDGNAAVCFAKNGGVCAVFVLAEEWRPEMASAIGELQLAGLACTVLSGDPNLRPLPWNAHGGLLPEDKLGLLHGLKGQGEVVAMVGDGINDTPALAASDVGFAMGCGADVARDAAGVCLLDNDLRKIPWTLALARRAVRTVKQNLICAFAFNLVGISFACIGKLNPVAAALAMTLSSLFVLANSLRGNDRPLPSSPVLRENGAGGAPRSGTKHLTEPLTSPLSVGKDAVAAPNLVATTEEAT